MPSRIGGLRLMTTWPCSTRTLVGEARDCSAAASSSCAVGQGADARLCRRGSVDGIDFSNRRCRLAAVSAAVKICEAMRILHPHDYDLFEDRSPVRGCNREVKRDLGGPER